MQNKSKIIIYCPSKLSHGGIVLLDDLLMKLKDFNYELFVHPQAAKLIKIKKNIKILWGGIVGRLLSEISLSFKTSQKDKILCYSNLPPIFLKNREISIFIQNRFIVDYNSDEHLDIKSKIRYLILRIIIHLKKKSVSRVFVQGDSMKNLAKKVFPSKCNIEIIRFFSKLKLNESSSQIKYDFLYIASGEKHKNHLNLFKALKLLEQKKQRCKICFTLSKSDRLKFSEYFNFFETSQFITVNNKTNLSRDEISNLYLASKALVFPSFVESLGLPLLEAKSLGINILASEKDFVRDVCNPDETFRSIFL